MKTVKLIAQLIGCFLLIAFFSGAGLALCVWALKTTGQLLGL
jgi:hypothetical protein